MLINESIILKKRISENYLEEKMDANLEKLIGI